MTQYTPDGIFTNRWAGSGMCYCEHCRQNFRAFSGLDLPRTLDPQDPARRQYMVWHQQRLFDLWRLWNEKIRAINPNASYIANAGGGALSELDMKTIGELAPTLFADRQARSGLMARGPTERTARNIAPRMGRRPSPASSAWASKKSIAGKTRCRAAMRFACGWPTASRRIFVHGSSSSMPSRSTGVGCRWLQEIYQWHYANQGYLRNERSFARVAMVYSQQTASFYGGEEARAKVEDPALGFYQALIEARIPFEMVHDHLLDAEHIARFKTLILPNIAALSTQQCEQIRAFVEQGGSVVATYETSLYDEWGVRRNDFGLASLFGASFSGRTGPDA